ncbi:hypothetical protein OQA88_10741 [Cercophora sp. LCS_1]
MAARQEMLNSLLSSGSITSEDEIEMRASLAQELLSLFQVSRNPPFLYSAIDQVETLVRRLPTDSPDMPVYLEQLSSMRVFEFEVTESIFALEQAVELSLKAKSEAVALGFPDSNTDAYLKILNGLGCSQFARSRHLNRPPDLDNAIATARELVDAASKDSRFYTMGLLNLTSRLRVRHSINGDEEDRNEAVRLLDQLSLKTPKDSPLYAAALFQLCAMSYAKFGDTGDIDDLDDAINRGESALLTMLRNRMVENLSELIKTLSGMYGDRYDKLGDLEDVRKAIFHAEQRVRLTGSANPAAGEALWRYLTCARVLAEKIDDVNEAEELVETAGELMATMPEVNYNRRDVNQWLYGDLLTRRYSLTSDIEHLIAVVQNACKMCKNENEKADGGPQVAVGKVMRLEACLREIAGAPENNKLRKAACEKLPGYFHTACEIHGTGNASMMLWNQQQHMIVAYSDAIGAGEEWEEADLDARILKEEAKAQQEERDEKAQEEVDSEPWAPSEYQTEFGLRNLSIDPTTKNVIFEVPGIVQDVFGYTETTPLPLDQFMAREIRLEQDARKGEEEQGGYPNPHLCRICRKLKVLVPRPDGGWKWNEKIRYIPYGNHMQLFLRQSCAVCGLILALISHKKRLHPRLAVIDPEVQGTVIAGETIESGEEILRVSYGLKEVGTLRILEADEQDQDQELPLQQLQRSLAECDNSHGRQCNRQALASRLSSPMEMLQIDVVDECLVRATSEVKYFALSYVWGNASISQTLKSNLDSRLVKGGLELELYGLLPQTISDAVAFVRSLGERYLWVDALCIVQDDEVTKQQNIQQMDKVYSRAFATIIVLSGSDADSGLPGARPGTRTALTLEEISISDRSEDLALDPFSEEVEQVRIAPSPSPLSVVLDTSVWNTRGWTFQERLLSARCIYISNDAVYFHCRKDMLLCETGEPESAAAPGLSILDNPLHELDRLDGRLVDDLSCKVGDMAQRIVFGTYAGLVEGYTARQLTFAGDVLNAFAGVHSVIARHMPKGEVCGLPGAFFDLALLWTPVRKLERREEVVVGGDAIATDGNGVCPRWTWAGYVGPVEYRMFGKDEEKRLLPAPLVVDGFRLCNGDKLLTIAGRKAGMVDDGQPVVKVEDVTDNTVESCGPNVLQFDAPVVLGTVFSRGGDPEYLCLKGESHSTGGQSVYPLYDRDEKQCGLCYEPMIPFDNGPGEAELSFVGIGRHRETGIPYRGPNRVEGDIPLFDRSVYEASGSESGVVDALVIAWGEDGTARRITVARIHVKAWEAAKPELKHVALR